MPNFVLHKCDSNGGPGYFLGLKKVKILQMKDWSDLFSVILKNELWGVTLSFDGVSMIIVWKGVSKWRGEGLDNISVFQKGKNAQHWWKAFCF